MLAISIHNIFFLPSIRDLLYIYTNFFRWTRSVWFLTFTNLLTITVVTYFVGRSCTWYARILFLVFLTAITAMQQSTNQMERRPTYRNFSETSVRPHPLPHPTSLRTIRTYDIPDLEGYTMVAGYEIQWLRCLTALLSTAQGEQRRYWYWLFQGSKAALVAKDGMKLRSNCNKNKTEGSATKRDDWKPEVHHGEKPKNSREECYRYTYCWVPLI